MCIEFRMSGMGVSAWGVRSMEYRYSCWGLRSRAITSLRTIFTMLALKGFGFLSHEWIVRVQLTHNGCLQKEMKINMTDSTIVARARQYKR